MRLPTEILFFIFKYLRTNDLIVAETVCQGWYRAARIMLYENVRFSDIKIARFLQLESSLQLELGSLIKKLYFSSTGELSQEYFSQFARLIPNIQEFDSGSIHAAKYLMMQDSQWKYLSKLNYRMKNYDACAHKFRYSLDEIYLLTEGYSDPQVLSSYLKEFTRLNTVNVALSGSASILVCDPIVTWCPKLEVLNLSIRSLMEGDSLPSPNTIVSCKSVLNKVTLDLNRFCPESIHFFIRKFPHIRKLNLSSEFYEWTDQTFQALNSLFLYVTRTGSFLFQFKTRIESYGFLHTLGNYSSLLSGSRIRKENKTLHTQQFQQNYTLITTSYHFPFSFSSDTNEHSCNTKIYYPCNASTFDRFEYTDECIKALGPNASSLTIQSYYHAEYSPSVTSSVLDGVIEKCKILTHITLAYEKRTILPLEKTSYSITHLALKESRLSLDFFKSIPRCLPYLESLELIDCSYISPDDISDEMNNVVLNLTHTNLQTLNLSDPMLNLVVICTGNKTRRFPVKGDENSNKYERGRCKSDTMPIECITVNCRSLKYLVSGKSEYLVDMDPEEFIIR